MNKKKLIEIIDVIAFLLFVLLTSTGVLLHYILPPRSGRFIDVWGLTRHEWGDIHFMIAVSFFAVLTVHLALHKKFISRLIRGKKQEGFSIRFALGVLSLLVIIALGIIPLLG